MHISVRPALIFSSGISMFFMNLLATSIKASFGQLGNQSREQQLIKEGNFLHRTLNNYPTGLIHRIICKFYLIQLMNKFHRGYGES